MTTPSRSKYAETSSSSHWRDSFRPTASVAEVRRGRPGVLDVVDPVGRGEQQHRRIVQQADLDEGLVATGTDVVPTTVDAPEDDLLERVALLRDAVHLLRRHVGELLRR